MCASQNSSMTRLSVDFTPGPCDVICARGSKARTHLGNLKFRECVQNNLQRYADSKSRVEKSIIVSKVVETIRSESPEGGFVKNVDGVWHEVGDYLAREKTSQTFRDGLHDLYRSSTKAKRKRRVAGIVDNVDCLVQSSKSVAKHISKLSSDIKQRGDNAPELFVSQMFLKANLDILEAFKKDASLLARFNEVEESQKMCAILA